jgi:hypothetical protein
MEISIKDNGKMEWLMVLELFVILKEVSMRVNGLKISNMVRELSTGTIIRSNMKEISLKEKNRVKVNSNVKEVHLLEILRMVNSTVREYITLLIRERYTGVVLFTISLMEKEK